MLHGLMCHRIRRVNEVILWRGDDEEAGGALRAPACLVGRYDEVG